MASSEELKNLIEECKAQRPMAQRTLYARFSGQLFATAIRHSNSREDAQDILQDSFVKIFKHIKSYRQDFSFEGWMRRIVVNTAITHYRKNLKHSHHQDIDDVPATPRDMENQQDPEFTAEELEWAESSERLLESESSWATWAESSGEELLATIKSFAASLYNASSPSSPS